MFLEVAESSVSFLIETSPASEPYLKFIQENLIEFLHRKATVEGLQNFKFNVGHFYKDTYLWESQVRCHRTPKVYNMRYFAATVPQKWFQVYLHL